MTTTANPAQKYRVIGTRPVRHDGVDKVTGAARYGADINLPGMLYARVLRSPHSHARIRSIDTSKAEALPGVVAVVTSADFPIIDDRLLDFAEVQGNARMIAENLMAKDKALYAGHAVAAVCATSGHIAQEALNLVEVDYEVLPTVLSWRDAMAEGATLIHDDMTTYFRQERFARGDDTGVKSNVAGHIQHNVGDVEQGFAESDIVIEREFETQTVHQGYIEPHVSTAMWSADGRVTVWTSTQGSFNIRAQTAAIIGVPESQVKVVPMEIGGGFGAKGITYLDPVAAALSRKAGQPVKVTMDRTEVFVGSGPASATFMRCKMGVKNDGTMVAGQLYMVYEAGAYPGSPVGGGALSGFGPYKMDHMLVDGLDVVCNKQKVQAYRAPGQPQVAFAVEAVVDELAEMLGRDPMDLRLQNAVQEGDRMPNGVPHRVFGCREMEEAMINSDHNQMPVGGPNRGRGVAVGFRWQAGQASSATININADGTLNLITGSVDIGGTRTAVAMQVAETLGIEIDDIAPTVVDTDTVGWTASTGGSRIAFDTGLAAIAAAEDLRDQMAQRCAMVWEVDPENVTFADGVFTCTSTEECMTFAEAAGRMMRTGGPLTASASATSTGVGPIFAGNIVDVEVDPDTGKVEILRCTAFIDSGTSVHPSYVEGQMQGGTVQGLGWALSEDYTYADDGHMLNSSFLDYRMPTALDLPMIETVVVEVPNPRHPYGLRGVGEAPIIPPLAALHNAVYHATGVRVNKLPLSPTAVLAAMQEANGQ